jgi:CRISPR-associated protein Csm1
MYQEVEIAALYALLHDIGKPVQRFLRRLIIGQEPGDKAREVLEKLAVFLSKDVSELERRAYEIKHDEVLEWFINTLTLNGIVVPDKIKSMVMDVVKKSDVLAAEERRLGEAYSVSTQLYGLVKRLIEEKFVEIKYEPENVPLMLPTWMLIVSGYLDTVGLKNYLKSLTSEERHRGGELRSYGIVERFTDIMRSLLIELDKCVTGTCTEDVLMEIRRIFQEIFINKVKMLDEKIWLPVRVITGNTLIELVGKNIKEASNELTYYEIVQYLLKGLEALLRLYKPTHYGLQKGLVNSLEQLLKYSCLLVPSAVFATLTPDISLYAHSKLTAAYASSIAALKGIDKLRLLVIDTNQIQQFIASPRRAGSASRVIRGRSLLIELALDAFTMYALELFGGLPRSNVITSEGGTLSIVTPDLPDFERRFKILTEVARELSIHEFAGRLGFTVAYSNVFDSSYGDFIRSLVEAKGGFREVLETLSLNLAVAKASRIPREPLYMQPSSIHGYDVITGEPIIEEPADQKALTLLVTPETKKYADFIAGPNKLREGEVIGKITHLSLIAGSLARNLIGVIGIYIYKHDKFPVPDRDSILKLFEKLKALCEGNLACEVKIPEAPLNIGFIPLSHIGSLYILISLRGKEYYDPTRLEHIKYAWSCISAFLFTLLDRLKPFITEFKDRVVKIDVKTVNTFINSIPGIEMPSETFKHIEEIVNKLLNLKVDVSFSCLIVNPYHPVHQVKKEEEKVSAERLEEVRLKDLDEYDLIAVGKMDCDSLGEIKRLLSHSPSRLVTLSELLNMILAGKSYLKALKDQDRYSDVIALYASGDDAVFYGDWMPVIAYMASVYRDIREVLYPLTFSLAITIDKSDTPLLLLYDDTINLLENHAKRVKASGVLKLSNPILVPSDGTSKVFVRADVMPLESYSDKYPWIDDITANWNLKCLSKILEHLYLANKWGSRYPKLVEFKNKVSEYRRDLYLVSMLGAKVVRLIEKLGEEIDFTKLTLELVPLEIEYTYMCTRRYSEFKELNEKVFGSELLRDICNLKIPLYPDDIVGSIERLHDTLRVILAAKPLLDHIILATRTST